MTRRPQSARPVSRSLILFLLLPTFASAARDQGLRPREGASGAALAKRPESRAVRFIRAFVVDERLSALRREADLQAPVIHRLRVGRPVFVVASQRGVVQREEFYRIAVTRRTRGWIHPQSIVIPGRPGEDARLLKLAEATSDSVDRIALCQLLIEQFNRSPLVSRAMLALGEEADRAAAAIGQRAQRRLTDVDEGNGVPARDYYLNDPGLDRYSRLRVRFDFNPATGEYVYDGQAYRAVIKRFPSSDEARLAREQLELVARRLAQR